MNLISNASLFIGPSTGPTHIANALGIHTISIYSPIKVQSALRWSPFFKQNLDKIRRLLYLEILGEPVYDFKRSTQIK